MKTVKATDLKAGMVVKLPTREWATLTRVYAEKAASLGKVPVEVSGANRKDHWFRPSEMVEVK